MITKKQAAILYAYDYKLQGKNRVIYSISCLSLMNKSIWLKLENNGYEVIVNLSQIGTDFKILCRPLSDLTKEMPGIGVPIVELAKIALPNPDEESFEKMNWFEYDGQAVLYDTGMESGYQFKFENGCFILEGHDYNAYCPNQEALFAWLDTHHFLRGVNEECLTYIKD